MTIINLDTARAARLSKRAAGYGMSVIPQGDLWALKADGIKTPELIGTLAQIAADLDVLDRQSLEPNTDIVLG